MEKECKYCGKLYSRNPKYSRRQWEKSKYCSLSCAKKDNPPSHEHMVMLGRMNAGRKLSPEHKRKIKESSPRGVRSCHWKGGISVDECGYLRIHKTKQRYHRYLMELHLGRKLARVEHIHHKNGNKLDNRIDNLKIVSSSEHSRIHKSLDGFRPCEKAKNET